MCADSVVGQSHRIEIFGELRRVVVKVGSGLIAPEGRLDPAMIDRLADDVVSLRERGIEVVMVVSGAVAAGYLDLGLEAPPESVVERQAAAAVGQYQLMARFARTFERHQLRVAQLLMMQEDIEDRRRFLSARHTLQELLRRGVVPIINENDPLADDEVKIGDNDHLAALVTSLSTADLLVILSTVPGVMRLGDAEDGGQGAASGSDVISTIRVGSEIDQHITDERSATGVGGMKAKVRAARLASVWGVPTVVASGLEGGLLPRIVDGEEIGSLFEPGTRRLTQRKRWIAIRTRSRGRVTVDHGARTALVEGGASLLPIGVVDVEGDFGIGARVDLLDPDGNEFAVGLASHPASEIRRMKGLKSEQAFRHVLGYRYVEAIVQREDLVLLGTHTPEASGSDNGGNTHE